MIYEGLSEIGRRRVKNPLTSGENAFPTASRETCRETLLIGRLVITEADLQLCEGLAREE